MAGGVWICSHLQVESAFLLGHATRQEVDAWNGRGNAAEHGAHCVLGHLLRCGCWNVQACTRHSVQAANERAATEITG
jgi:hypothetical protein